MGSSVEAAIGYYPAWDSDDSRCLFDTNVPEYMRLNPSLWTYDNLEDCCERYYSWDQDCVANSGGGDDTTYTGKIGSPSMQIDVS